MTGAYDDELQVDGAISRISPVVDPTTGTVKVTVDVAADQTVIRPGQYVKVRIEVDRHTDVLTIPRRALVWDDGEPIAWKVIEAKPPEPSEDDEERDEDDDESGGFLAGLFGGDEAAEEIEEDDIDPLLIQNWRNHDQSHTVEDNTEEMSLEMDLDAYRTNDSQVLPNAKSNKNSKIEGINP